MAFGGKAGGWASLRRSCHHLSEGSRVCDEREQRGSPTATQNPPPFRIFFKSYQVTAPLDPAARDRERLHDSRGGTRGKKEPNVGDEEEPPELLPPPETLHTRLRPRQPGSPFSFRRPRKAGRQQEEHQ